MQRLSFNNSLNPSPPKKAKEKKKKKRNLHHHHYHHTHTHTNMYVHVNVYMHVHMYILIYPAISSYYGMNQYGTVTHQHMACFFNAGMAKIRVKKHEQYPLLLWFASFECCKKLHISLFSSTRYRKLPCIQNYQIQDANTSICLLPFLLPFFSMFFMFLISK